MIEEDGSIEITAPVEAFKVIADALHKAKVQPEEAGLRMHPKQEMELDAEAIVGSFLNKSPDRMAARSYERKSG